MGIFLSEGAYVGEMRKDAKIIDGDDKEEPTRAAPLSRGLEGRRWTALLVVYIGKGQAVVERQRDGTNRSYFGISQSHTFVVDV